MGFGDWKERTEQAMKDKADAMKAKGAAMQAETDAGRTKPWHVTDNELIVAVHLVPAFMKQGLNTISDYKAKGYRIAGVVEEEATHVSLILMEKV